MKRVVMFTRAQELNKWLENNSSTNVIDIQYQAVYDPNNKHIYDRFMVYYEIAQGENNKCE